MSKREEMRNLETIPVGSLGIVALEGCKALGEKSRPLSGRLENRARKCP